MPDLSNTMKLAVDALDDPGSLRVRGDALEVLLNRQPPADVWLQSESRIHNFLSATDNDPGSRIRAIELAAISPLASVRKAVQAISVSDEGRSARAARMSLALLGDRQSVTKLIEDLTAEPTDGAVARVLAQVPLESLDLDVSPLVRNIAALDDADPGESTSHLWTALALARVGKFDHLDSAIDKLNKGWSPDILWGNPETFASEIRAMRPAPAQLTESLEKKMRGWPGLLGKLFKPAIDPESPPGHIYRYLTESAPETAQTLKPSMDHARVVATLQDLRLPGDIKVAMPESGDISADVLARNTADAFDRSLTAIANDAGLRDVPPEMVLGNDFITLVDNLPAYEPDYQALATAYIKYVGKTGERSHDFEAQIGWMFSRGGFDNIRLDGFFNSEDSAVREIAWSLAKHAARFDGSDVMPYFGAGADTSGTDDLYRAARHAELIEMPELFGGDEGPTFRGGESQSEEEEPGPVDPGDDPPRSAYGLVKAPGKVRPAKPFTVTVGLSKEQMPGTTGGQLVRPESSRGAYWLKIRLTCDGFRSVSEQGSEAFLWVTQENPYPTEDIELVALDDERFSSSRIILAEFYIDGQMLGAAARQIDIDDSLSVDSADAVASGVSVVVDSQVPPADITITISRGNADVGFRWVFSAESPHGDIDMTPPDDPERLVAHLDEQSEDFARSTLNRIETREGATDLREIVADAGERIAEQIPLWIRSKLLAVFDRVDDRAATLLIVSAEPHIPWELAYLQFQDDSKQFLAMEMVVGRWVLSSINARTMQPEIPVPPPHSVDVSKMTVVSGDYSDTKGFNKLPGAEAEAQRLRSTFEATSLDASSDALLPWFRSGPEDELIHFSVHGKWSTTGVNGGIALVDGKMLDASFVRQSKLSGHPFVFLNACQIGQGQTVLGGYGGMAEAFLKAGAVGVVAPLWSVDDKSANEVAKRFYDWVLSDETPGEFVRRERSSFGDESTSVTSLAYQFFGHPAMRIAMNIERNRRDA